MKLKKNKNPSENLIHIMFEHEDAVESKKNILYCEKNFLNISKIMRNYSSLRSEENRIKLKLHKRLKELASKMRKMEKILPKIRHHPILKEEKKYKIEIQKKDKERKNDEDIEFQLQEIQKKLNSLN